MALKDWFSEDYEQARARFREAAGAAGAVLSSFENPCHGPDGGRLTCDLAYYGPPQAEAVLVTISATHGVEGFCGSGCQVGSFATAFQRRLPAGMAFCQIHALNPFGFAWQRRVTEENVDINRNFVDHAAPYPDNADYRLLRPLLCPPEWNDQVIAETRAALDAFVDENGLERLNKAISSGQYSDPEGIFFGGWAPTWSHRLLKRILHETLGGARRVAVIDYHTGLGPYGYGERICVHRPESAALARARAWYEDDVTSPYLGSSTSVEIQGPNASGVEAALPQAEVTMIALEYGTLPSADVRLALRADNWLHVHSDPATAQGLAIKQQIREAFYQDKADWKEAIFARAEETLVLALRGLAEG